MTVGELYETAVTVSLIAFPSMIALIIAGSILHELRRPRCRARPPHSRHRPH